MGGEYGHGRSYNIAHQYDKEQGAVFSCFLGSGSRLFRFDFTL